MLKNWNDLPDFMRCEEIKAYYEALHKKRFSLFLKRLFDVVAAIFVLLITLIPMIILAVFIKLDSPGPIFFRQERVTQYGKIFRIHKFRTMIPGADLLGSQVTIKDDNRITKLGRFLRKYRLDELPQVFDVIKGDMTFVGTRPETVKYVSCYQKQWNATLLLPAGITSETSIKYKDEDNLLKNSLNIDNTYIEVILPQKMIINLQSLLEFSIFNEMKTLFKTVYKLK